MLTTQEFEIVCEEVTDLVAESHYRTSIPVIFGVDGPAFLRHLKVDYGAPNECAHDIVTACVSLKWTATPSHLERLLVHLANVRGVARLAPLVARVAAGVDPLGALYDAQWIIGENPFFARGDLRPLARELVDQAARPILRINGESGHGHSYTNYFFDFLSHEKGNALHIAVARLEKDQGPLYKVRELVADLVCSMGIADSEIPDPSGSSYAAALKRFVLANALARSGRWIFVLEGFDQQYVDKEVREFVEHLAHAVCSGEFRKKARVVLINYRSALPVVVKGDILEETLRPPRALQASEILKCLRALDEKRRKEGRTPWELANLGRVAETILKDAPPDGKERLQAVYDSLITLRDVA